MTAQPQDNSDQISYWNGPDSTKWVRNQQGMDQMLAPFSDHVMDHVGITPGMRILDIGCGCGTTTAELARRAGPDGHATGVDVSAPMLEIARNTMAGPNVDFLEADASQMAPGQDFDLLFSRFGVMFFADAGAAFSALAATLKPGGRLAFACWQTISENHWMLQPVLAAKKHVEMPPRGAPGEPGPFAFANPDDIRAVLETGGFSEIEITPYSQPVALGRTAEDALQSALEVGPVGTVLKNVDAETQARVRQSVSEVLSQNETADGIFLKGSIWCVTARRS